VKESRYHYYNVDNTVICIVFWHNKRLRTVAKCDMTVDSFDYETGRKLARKRMDVKISLERKKRTEKYLAELNADLEVLMQRKTRALAKLGKDTYDA
jgi:hypothetical protein